MAQRRSLAWTELKVGILVIASFVLLALAIFLIGGDSSLFTPKYTLLAYFANANNLKSGAEVQLEGVTIGNVHRVGVSTESDPNKTIVVQMSLDKQYQNVIRSDSEVAIKTIGLLGDQYIEISKGTTAGQVVEENGYLVGRETGDIKRIIEGTDDFVANLELLSDKITKMAERVDRGEGTLGKLLTDTSIYDNANLATKEINLLLRDARTGPGTVGRLLSDDELHQKISNIADRLDNVVARIESGNGTAGKFLNDPALYNRTDQLILKAQVIFDRIERGEGTLGKLSKDEALYNDVRTTMNKFSNLVASVEGGTGTLGKLVTDPTLFNSLNQTTSEILKLLYDFRQDPKKFLTISFRLF